MYLTKAEEQIMRYLWKLEKAFLKDIVDQFPEPKPAYTTISTVIRVLVRKKFIGFSSFSKVYQYFPLVSKREYFKQHFRQLKKNFFDDSAASFASYFTDNESITISDLEQIKKLIDNEISQRKTREREEG